MSFWDRLLGFMGGQESLRLWFVAFLASILIAGTWSGFFKARKVQPKGFKWKTLRTEAIVAVITLAIVGPMMGFASGWLARNGWIAAVKTPAAWWQIALEYAAYFLLFDTWFYWFHRLMHKEPMYKWVHKVHHWSTSPNLLENHHRLNFRRPASLRRKGAHRCARMPPWIDDDEFRKAFTRRRQRHRAGSPGTHARSAARVASEKGVQPIDLPPREPYSGSADTTQRPARR